jgi:hypothetical protein
MIRIGRPNSRARLLIATATPASNPPPPTPITTVSTSGICSKISNPMVPWPETTSTLSNGWTKTAPLCSA